MFSFFLIYLSFIVIFSCRYWGFFRILSVEDSVVLFGGGEIRVGEFCSEVIVEEIL